MLFSIPRVDGVPLPTLRVRGLSRSQPARGETAVFGRQRLDVRLALLREDVRQIGDGLSALVPLRRDKVESCAADERDPSRTLTQTNQWGSTATTPAGECYTPAPSSGGQRL